MIRLIITNAIYFKGTWEWQFDPKDTTEMNFKITPTKTVKVQMMYMKPENTGFNYADLGDLEILELPYKGEEVSMLILLSKEDLNAIESNLTIEKLNEYKNQMRETSLEAIYLPKFEFNTKYHLERVLSALGIPTAFNPSLVNFSGMTTAEKLWVDFVIHKAYVKVDEKGTEAAAATAVGIGESARAIFRADHPFIFIIQQKNMGNILFLGRVVDPTNTT